MRPEVRMGSAGMPSTAGAPSLEKGVSINIEIIGLPDDDFIHPSVKAEILRRKDELGTDPD